MKRINVILMMASVLALASCGLADPWKTWENEGEQPSDRLLPSELKETLCLADWWKCSYENEDFYFQFIDDGTVESNSTLLRDAESTTYYINWEEPYSLLLTVVGGGHFSHLSSGKEETLVVTSFDDSEIKCSGSESGTAITFVPATSSDVSRMVAAKADEYKKLEVASGIVSAGMASGAVWSSGAFVAHYYLDLSVYKAYTARFDILENNVLRHQTVGVSIGLDGTASLSPAVTVAGKSISSISIDVNGKSVSAGSGFTAAVSNSGDWFSGRTSGYSTYEIHRDGSKGAASKAIWDEITAAAGYSWGNIEVSDRAGRPFFCCPDGSPDGQWYVGVYSVDTPYVSQTELDRVYFTGGVRTEMPYGGDGKWASWIVENHPVLIATYSAEEGVIVVKDGDTGPRKVWVLSPVNDNWYMAEKD